MNENLKRYFAIILALWQVLGYQPCTHRDRHLTTLAALISGLVASGKPQSRQKRYTRWLQNESIDCATCFYPFAKGCCKACLLAHQRRHYVCFDGRGFRELRLGRRAQRSRDFGTLESD